MLTAVAPINISTTSLRPRLTPVLSMIRRYTLRVSTVGKGGYSPQLLYELV